MLLLAAVVNGWAVDPREVPSSDLAAIVAVVAAGEPVRITPGASGFNLFGKEKSGRVASSASGLAVTYGGKTYSAAQVAGGWLVTGNGLSTRLASRAGGLAISGTNAGSAAALNTGETRIRLDGKSLDAVPTATGGQTLR